MIRFENVTKTYKNSNKIALKNINLSFGNQGLVFIVGESGSGKTTLLNLLGLLDTPTDGQIWFDSLNTNALTNHQKDVFRNQSIGIIFQNINLIEELTIKENILLPLQLQQKSKTNDEVLSQLKTLNLEENINTYPKYLSGGERQRIAISRALSKDAQVLIADEPTGSLDEKNANNTMAMLKQVSKDRLVIVVTHQTNLARQFGDRIIYLDHGNVVNDHIINETIDTRSTQGDSSLTQNYRLPFNVSLKFAYKWFTYKSGRMFFALITFFLTLICFIIALTIFQFDDHQAIKNGLDNEGIRYVKIHKRPEPGQTISDLMFTKDEHDVLTTLFDENQYIQTQINHGIAKTISLNGGDATIENYATLTESKVQLFGFTLIGQLPDNDSMSTEVVITNRVAYELGWLTQSNFKDHEAFETIINTKTLIVNFVDGNQVHRYEFSITGVLDTDYAFSNPLIENSTYQQLFEDELTYGLHLTLFFGKQVADFILNLDQKEIGSIGLDKAAKNYYVSSKNDGYYKAIEFQETIGKDFVLVNSRLDYSMHMINEMKNMITQVALVLGGLFLLTSLITFAGYIHNMVMNKENSIRIMRSLGTRFRDMNTIFILQDIFISVITVLLASLASLVIGHYINQSIKTEIYVLIPLVNPTIWIPTFILLLTFCFAFVITYLQLKKNYRQTKVIE